MRFKAASQIELNGNSEIKTWTERSVCKEYCSQLRSQAAIHGAAHQVCKTCSSTICHWAHQPIYVRDAGEWPSTCRLLQICLDVEPDSPQMLTTIRPILRPWQGRVLVCWMFFGSKVRTRACWLRMLGPLRLKVLGKSCLPVRVLWCSLKALKVNGEYWWLMPIISNYWFVIDLTGIEQSTPTTSIRKGIRIHNWFRLASEDVPCSAVSGLESSGMDPSEASLYFQLRTMDLVILKSSNHTFFASLRSRAAVRMKRWLKIWWPRA